MQTLLPTSRFKNLALSYSESELKAIERDYKLYKKIVESWQRCNLEFEFIMKSRNYTSVRVIGNFGEKWKTLFGKEKLLSLPHDYFMEK